ncbi:MULTISPECIES: SCO3242 family prenyltransferase [Streptomyces]|uniref:UbiA family prenyltransferase n=1 Tax=Streptomyces solicathayae TaxID=3081768 RepID=A0ABZ0M2P6_9ACTN|nr:UbiA family prenyltransferase [Streptomyces sp. HUAS YS2]WOX25790.1 UbiA family prenyltransferase [Streptomyces sp. HUAS YS2]
MTGAAGAATGARALLELVRAPAALTVLGDTLAGSAATGRPVTVARTARLTIASTCLYWAGMALNDYADREVDAEERPGRPLPSGRISPRAALATAAALTGAGLTAAAAEGRDALAVAVPLAATVWAYDLALKNTPYGPAAMAAARGLDVLMGAGARRARHALAPAALLAGHTYAVTTVSRKETLGAGASLPAGALAATGTVGLVAAALTPPTAARAHRVASTALLAGYALAAGSAQLAATVRPDTAHLKRTVGAGIHAMIPLQAALAARGGSVRAAFALLAAYPLARGLSRKVSPT